MVFMLKKDMKKKNLLIKIKNKISYRMKINMFIINNV